MKPTLYNLTGDFLQLQERLDDPDEDIQAIEDTLEAIEGNIVVKASNIVQVLKNLSSPIQAIDAEINRLKAKKTAIQAKTDRLKDYIKTNMEAMQLDKIETDLIKIRLQNSPPSCERTAHLEDIPEEYTTTEIVVTVNKKKAIADLKAGKEIPGLELRQGKHLRIS